MCGIDLIAATLGVLVVMVTMVMGLPVVLLSIVVLIQTEEDVMRR